MGRMQLLALGLVLGLSWAGWASSTTVDPNKLEGFWNHIYTASNDLQKYRDQDFLRLFNPYFHCFVTCKYPKLITLDRYEGRCRYVTSFGRPRRGGILQILVRPGNILDVLEVTDSLLLLGYIDQTPNGDTYYAVLALCRSRELSDADTEKFHNVLKQKGIVEEPVHFIDYGEEFTPTCSSYKKKNQHGKEIVSPLRL